MGDNPPPQPHSIVVPEVKKTSGEIIAFATEIAFNALIDRAQHDGLPIARPMGFEYLPIPESKEKFRESCAEILKSLIIPS